MLIPQGNFVDGFMHGPGEYTWADGVKYKVCRLLGDPCTKNTSIMVHRSHFTFTVGGYHQGFYARFTAGVTNLVLDKPACRD